MTEHLKATEALVELGEHLLRQKRKPNQKSWEVFLQTYPDKIPLFFCRASLKNSDDSLSSNRESAGNWNRINKNPAFELNGNLGDVAGIISISHDEICPAPAAERNSSSWWLCPPISCSQMKRWKNFATPWRLHVWFCAGHGNGRKLSAPRRRHSGCRLERRFE